LLLSDSELVATVFNVRAFLCRPKNKLLEFSHDIVSAKGTKGLSDRDLGDVWSKLRETVTRLSATISPTTPLISQKSAELARRLAKVSRSVFDPFMLVQTFTVDLYGEIAFGSQYRRDIGNSFMFWCDHARDFFNGLQVNELEKHLQNIGKFLDELEPIANDSSWFNVLSKERSDQPKDVLKATIFDVMAYSLNNAFTVNYGLFLLGVRPTLQERLFDEIHEVAPNRDFSVVDLHRMPLLMQVVKEVNRAYPGGGGILSRQSFEDTQIDAKIVRAGTVAIVNSLLMHHDPRFYERPNEFDPSRWKEASLETLLDDTSNMSFLTYGAGEKSCPANRFAMMQQAITLAKIIETIHVTYALPAPPKVELGFGARFSSPVQITTRKR